MAFVVPMFAALGTAATAGVATGTAAVAAGVATTAMVAGGVVSAVGAIKQGKEAKRQAEFQAQQAEIQANEEKIGARVSATNAATAEADAEYSRQQIMRERDRVLGSQRSAVAKSGLTLSGSAIYAMGDTAAEFETEANRTFFNGLNIAGNYRGQSAAGMRSSSNLLTTASEYRRSGRAAKKSGMWSAAGSLLSTVGSVGLTYAGWGAKGAAASGAVRAGATGAGKGILTSSRGYTGQASVFNFRYS